MKNTEKRERNNKQLIEKYCIKIMCFSAGVFVREVFFLFHYFLMSIFCGIYNSKAFIKCFQNFWKICLTADY